MFSLLLSFATMKRCSIEAHFFQALCQHISAFLLVDKNDDWWFDTLEIKQTFLVLAAQTTTWVFFTLFKISISLFLLSFSFIK